MTGSSGVQSVGTGGPVVLGRLSFYSNATMGATGTEPFDLLSMVVGGRGTESRKCN